MEPVETPKVLPDFDSLPVEKVRFGFEGEVILPELGASFF